MLEREGGREKEKGKRIIRKEKVGGIFTNEEERKERTDRNEGLRRREERE